MRQACVRPYKITRAEQHAVNFHRNLFECGLHVDFSLRQKDDLSFEFIWKESTMTLDSMAVMHVDLDISEKFVGEICRYEMEAIV